MGRSQHYSCGGEFRLGQVDIVTGHREETQSALGGHSLHGKSTLSGFRLHTSWREELMAAKDSFYKTLTPDQSKRAFANDYDFDSPEVYTELVESVAFPLI